MVPSNEDVTRLPLLGKMAIGRRVGAGVIAAAVVLGGVVWLTHQRRARSVDAVLLARAQQIFRPLPDTAGSVLGGTTAMQELGRRLFFDPRFSIDGKVSCATCHQPALYGTDGLALGVGVLGRRHVRNAPTVLNAYLAIANHWRGDRASVEDQALKALTSPQSTGNPDVASAEAKIRAILLYRELFAKAFPGDTQPVTAGHFASAVGAYERTLVTPSPFDAYLRGQIDALSPAARRGLRLFTGVGCTSCHNGVGVGGGMFQKFGIYEDYWRATRSGTPDQGRFDVTHLPSDRYVFRVPSLRNAEKTPPYFHDGSVTTLEDAVRVMARVQLNRQLDDAQVSALVAFIRSLTGTVPPTFSPPN